MSLKPSPSQGKKAASKNASAAQRDLMRRSTQTYGMMIAISLVICSYVHTDFRKIFLLPESYDELLRFATIAILGVGIVAVIHELGKQLSESYNHYKNWFAEMLGRLTLPGALYLATLSSVAEELLFRVTVQPYLGVMWTSTLLAMLHLSPRGFSPAIYLSSFLTNAVIGLIYEFTGNIYPSLLIHLSISAYSLIKHSLKSQQTNTTLPSDGSSS